MVHWQFVRRTLYYRVDMDNSRVRNLLHETLVFAGWLGRLGWPYTVLFIGVAGLGLVLPGAPLSVALWLVLWSAADWTLLASLPRRGFSYGTVQPTHLALLAVRWPLAWLALPVAAAGWLAQPALWVVAAYALLVEPRWLQVTGLNLRDRHAAPRARPLSIVQLSDLHVERLTRREEEVLATVERLQPDLILLTGDYLNLSYVHDEKALAEVRRFLEQLHAHYGVYAIRGTLQVDPPSIMPQLFEGLDITVLEGERRELDVAGHRLRLVGVGCNRDMARDGQALASVLSGADGDRYTILLYHMPDLFERAGELGVDLHLAGHTHGGQLRLPLYGALLTASTLGKRYEAGPYRRNGSVLYVSRGIGLEGLGAPRARFLCRPEVVHIQLQ